MQKKQRVLYINNKTLEIKNWLCKVVFVCASDSISTDTIDVDHFYLILSWRIYIVKWFWYTNFRFFFRFDCRIKRRKKIGSVHLSMCVDIELVSFRCVSFRCLLRVIFFSLFFIRFQNGIFDDRGELERYNTQRIQVVSKVLWLAFQHKLQ